MKITDERMRRVLSRYIQQQSQTARVKNTGCDRSCAKDPEYDTPSDRVTLSEQALHIRHALYELEDSAKAHLEKVESIRRDLESGRYDVTGAMVAEKLLEP